MKNPKNNYKHRDVKLNDIHHDKDIDASQLKLSSNDISPEKNENTETVAPENRINTDGL
jgi:hypothetical protein